MYYQIGSEYVYKTRFSQLDFNRFASLSGDDNPIHVDSHFASQTKFGKTVAHGMLLYSAISRCLSEQFPSNFQHSVQLKFSKPTFANQEVSISQVISGKDADQELLEISSQVLHHDGGSGCESQILLSTSLFSDLDDGGADRSLPPISEDDISLKGLKIGETASHSKTFSQSDINEYIDLTGDLNQLHKNLEYIRAKGLRNLVVPTPLIGGLFSYLLGKKLPGKGTNWLKLSLYRITPAYLGENIKAQVLIARIRVEKELINLNLEAVGPGGRLICHGEALVLVKDVPGPN